jgi:hypothetical protein
MVRNVGYEKEVNAKQVTKSRIRKVRGRTTGQVNRLSSHS